MIEPSGQLMIAICVLLYAFRLKRVVCWDMESYDAEYCHFIE